MPLEEALCLEKLGICQALMADYASALSTYQRSAVLLRTCEHVSSATARGEVYVEFAVAALRAGLPRRSLAAMLAASRTFESQGDTRGTALVASLGLQLMGIPKTENVPSPGITLALPRLVDDARAMKKAALPLALGAMAAAHGAKGLAHRLFRRAYSACKDDPALRSPTVALAFTHSLQSDVFDFAPWAARLSSLPPSFQHPGMVSPWDLGRVADAVLSQTMALVQSPDASSKVERVLQIWRSSREDTPSRDHVLVEECLEGLQSVLRDGEDQRLEDSFMECLDARAYVAARSLAWFRGLVFPKGRPDSIASILLWHWRLSWLTLARAIVEPDLPAQGLAMLRTFWSVALDETGTMPAIMAMRQRVADTTLNLSDLMDFILDQAAPLIGFGRLYPEVARCLSAGVSTRSMRSLVVRTMLDFLLVPVDSEIKRDVAAEIPRLLKGTEGLADGHERRAWQEELAALADIWQSTDPASDGLFVALHGASFRALGAPSEQTQEAADMGTVIGHAKPLAHDLGDARTCPKVGRKTGRLGPFQQDALQTPASCGTQLQWTARSRLGAKAAFSAPPIGRLPSPHAATVHPDTLRHFHGRIPLLQQRHRTLTPTFQFLWTPGWSHGSPPDQSIGHYLYSCQ